MRHFKIVWQGRIYEVDAEEIFSEEAPEKKAEPAVKQPEPEKPAPAAPAAAENAVQALAPVSGLVMDVPVSIGDAVNEGDTLVVLDAMKMEIPVCAEKTGRIASIAVKKGDFVDMGQLLMSII